MAKNLRRVLFSIKIYQIHIYNLTIFIKLLSYAFNFFIYCKIHKLNANAAAAVEDDEWKNRYNL